MNFHNIIKSIALLAIISLTSSVSAADFYVKYNESKTKSVLLMDGHIGLLESERFKEALEKVKKDGKFSNIVFLAGPGGIYHEAKEISKIIKEEDIKTATLPNAICYSGCANIWASANKRFYFNGSKIGFHLPFLSIKSFEENGKKNPYNESVQDLGWQTTVSYVKNDALVDAAYYIDTFNVIDPGYFLMRLASSTHKEFWMMTAEEAAQLLPNTTVRDW